MTVVPYGVTRPTKEYVPCRVSGAVVGNRPENLEIVPTSYHGFPVGAKVRDYGDNVWTVAWRPIDPNEYGYHESWVPVIDAAGNRDGLPPSTTILVEALDATKDSVVGDPRTDWNGLVALAAAKHGRSLEFSYSKASAPLVLERRRVQPSSVEPSKDGVSIRGYDPDRAGIRTFRLDRIVGWVAAS